MTLSKENGKNVVSIVNEAVEFFSGKPEELIPILSRVNKNLGYLSSDALREISQRLRIPQSQVMSVASFYQMLYTKPVGRHVIKFCESAPCHVVGGRQVWSTIMDVLNLKPGETSSDGKWTLTTVSCLGICAVGPVMMIDDDVYGNLTPEQIPSILAQYE